MDRLDACRVVDVRDGGDVGPLDVEPLDAPQLLLSGRVRDPPLLPQRRHQEHVRAVGIELEIVGHPISKDRRCEGAERLPKLDLQIHGGLHRGISRVADDAPRAERPGPELHPPVEPADDLARRELVGEAVE